MIDIVIPLGKGSICLDEELRYSLRSIEKHAKGIGNVYVIGEKPWFLSDEVTHIPLKDRFQKEANIKEKILKACSIPELSEMFCFVNDDIYWLKDIDAETIPFYRKWGTDLPQSRKAFRNTYGISMQNTEQVLTSKKLPCYHFDIHVPILYNKKVFPAIMAKYDWTINQGYVIKSLYCNTLRIPGEQLKDNKINNNANSVDLRSAFQSSKIWVSSSDRCLSGEFWNIVKGLYPKKCIYEK